MIRLVLADDQALVRAGFVSILEREPDVQVVGEAADGEHVVSVVREERPDVVLMDIRMPRVDGLEAARLVLDDPSCGDVKVIMLTTFGDEEYVYQALRSGASGFLLKDVEPADLVRAIRAVHGGDAMLSTQVTRTLLAGLTARQPAGTTPKPDVSALTEREREVMMLVVAGLSNDDISSRLHISLATAKAHVSRLLSKLGVRDRAQLIIVCYESGVVTPGWSD